MAEHTQGKLSLDQTDEAPVLVGEDGVPVAFPEAWDRGVDEVRANARRIAACWNALVNVSTDDIERGDAFVTNPVIP